MSEVRDKKFISKKEKSLRWCFTAWDFNSVLNFMVNKKHLVRYCVVGEELCPTTSKLHYQGYIEFLKDYEFSSVRRIWPDRETHWEISRENRECCTNYCLKNSRKVICHGITALTVDDIFN